LWDNSPWFESHSLESGELIVEVDYLLLLADELKAQEEAANTRRFQQMKMRKRR